MEGKYSVLNIAGYIVEYCNKHYLHITHLRLQKLLYFIQAYFLMKSNGEIVAFNEEIEAWDLGPIVPCIYHQYKRFGNGYIPFLNDNSYAGIFSNDDKKNIEEVILHFKDKSSIYMMEVTHDQNPWIEAYNKQNLEKVITKKSIYEYFVGKHNMY